MQLKCWRLDLQLTHRWTVASALAADGSGGKDVYEAAFVELKDGHGVVGLGETAPSSRYQENVGSALAFLQRVDPARLSFADVPASMRYLDSLAPGEFSAKGAVNVALLDGRARQAGQTIHDHLELGFTEGRHLTSFSIGIAAPEAIRQKVSEAAPYPVLKLKLGSPRDRENLAALREAAPEKRVRVDANEAWPTKEQALSQIEWLAADGRVEFVEQPMPAATPLPDWAWLKQRSPLPLMADESYRSAQDAERCAEGFHAVNVKLAKTAGLTGALAALQAARRAGLKTMLGCMIESSLLISAAAHLADLTDYLDLDGNLLISNDPFCGVTTRNGIISFREAPERLGLCVRARARK